MASGKTVLEAVDQLNYRWWNEGVAVRLLECSMTCMSKWKGGRFWQGAEMRRRGGVVRYQISDKDCVSPEMSRDLGPASLLRWDLPNAIFNMSLCALSPRQASSEGLHYTGCANILFFSYKDIEYMRVPSE